MDLVLFFQQVSQVWKENKFLTNLGNNKEGKKKIATEDFKRLKLDNLFLIAASLYLLMLFKK